MSEEKYEDKVLKLLTTIAEQTKPPAKPAESSKTSTELINLHTHTPKEMFDCPSCGEPYLREAEKRLKAPILKSYGESLKGKQTVKCKECGLQVAREEEKCPGCGGTEAE